jgi:hypothetical protein
MGQTNEQQRTFNEWAISELHEEVDSIKTSLNFKTTLYPPTSNNVMSSLSFSSGVVGSVELERLKLFLLSISI